MAKVGKISAITTLSGSMGLSNVVGQLVELVLTATGIMLIVLAFVMLVASMLLEPPQIRELQRRSQPYSN